MLRVASVNVNGIRAAARRGIDGWLADRRPDVLLLQEVRASDAQLRAVLGEGWDIAHVESDVAGRAGVAVAARSPIVGVRSDLGGTSGRWVEADVDLGDGDPLTVASVYVHKGEAGTDRMVPKLAFLDAVTTRLGELGGRRAVVGGDLNIAHREVDLKNHQGNRGSAGFLPQERAYLDRWTGELGWVDLGRALGGPGPGPYTWWSWRGKAFDNDAGWRIDYVLATRAVAGGAAGAAVDRAPSYAERFSDHAPVVVDLAL